MRVYIPATIPILRQLVEDREFFPLGATAFAVTPALREAYAAGDDDELAEVAMQEAARASMRLIAAERDGLDDTTADDEGAAANPGSPVYRRAVVAADVIGAKLRPDLDDAVVKLAGPIGYDQVASVHVDLAEAEPQVAKAVDVIDAADLGDPDAEFVLGDAEDHQLAWYATQELSFLLDLL
ncbi:hypothetical protein BOX37_24545 [Nocardia mangyaensis]|uniref:Uncharacterized protein n=1 Tax=Nocardia mangyaensis TaxID=2213200 RepID=A0A1J0W317_9NOCA|nr:hypothetical protein [Nocardia mangyaensis]APE38699.1 hypothetical protein BOX37_24545 [Nocardia mangyaensis]